MSKKKSNARRIAIIIWIIIILIIVFISLGAIGGRSKKEKEEERKEEEEAQRKEIEALRELKNKRLQVIEPRIEYLQAKKARLERLERKIKFWVRLSIGVIFVCVNYLYHLSYEGENEFEKISGRLLNFNACIITGYSFLAFIIYGSIDSFIKHMKLILGRVLKRNHYGSLEELELLLKERTKLIIEIEEIDKN